MSTRCNIILKEGNEKIIFYKHSDGYPEGTMPLLTRFIELMRSNLIRDNIMQSSGWLVILGAIHYQTISGKLFPDYDKESYDVDHNKIDGLMNEFKPKDWLCGAIEITTDIHGDIDFLYEIDLDAKEVRCYEHWDDNGGTGTPVMSANSLEQLKFA